MTTINELQYNVACRRVEELLKVVDNETPSDNRYLQELDLLSEIVADYETENFPVHPPSLIEVIKLRMYEKNLSQKGLSELLGVSNSRISELLSGKTEPTLQMARKLSQTLNIEPSIVLGVEQ